MQTKGYVTLNSDTDLESLSHLALHPMLSQIGLCNVWSMNTREETGQTIWIITEMIQTTI